MPKKKIRKPARAQRAGARRQPARKAAPANALRKHETEIGVTVHGNRPHRLILVENALDGIAPASHAEASAYAKKMGGDLPSRIDGLVLFARAKDRFKTDTRYWTSEDYAGNASDAWLQWFNGGFQDNWPKDGTGRVCVVRRVPL